MQHACGDSPAKSAAGLNAMPMPSRLSSPFMPIRELRLTFGSAMASWLVGAPGKLALPRGMSRVVIARSAATGGIGHPAAPEAGSIATIASLPPRYGSDTAVQPPALVVRKSPPCMNFTLIRRPAAVVNGPALVWLARNGVAQAACRY